MIVDQRRVALQCGCTVLGVTSCFSRKDESTELVLEEIVSCILVSV
jgi:hypothetical protein